MGWVMFISLSLIIHFFIYLNSSVLNGLNWKRVKHMNLGLSVCGGCVRVILPYFSLCHVLISIFYMFISIFPSISNSLSYKL